MHKYLCCYEFNEKYRKKHEFIMKFNNIPCLFYLKYAFILLIFICMRDKKECELL